MADRSFDKDEGISWRVVLGAFGVAFLLWLGAQWLHWLSFESPASPSPE